MKPSGGFTGWAVGRGSPVFEVGESSPVGARVAVRPYRATQSNTSSID